jgi:hypothetical protein
MAYRIGTSFRASRAQGTRAIGLSAVLLALALTGCASGMLPVATPSPGVPKATAGQVMWQSAHLPLTGAQLSALIPTPTGFTFDSSESRDSGTKEATPVPGPSSASGITCASWEEGQGYYGPGTVGYSVRNYTGPGQIVSLEIEVNIYPAGTGTKMFEMSMGVERRCLDFSYKDQNGLSYTVRDTLGSSAGLGDQSGEDNSVLTAADGTEFTSQGTIIQVGDALITVNETSEQDAPLNRVALPLARIVAALRSAGY